MVKLVFLVALGLIAFCQARLDANITLKYEDVISALREVSDPDVIPIEEDDPKPVEITLEQSLLYVAKADQHNDVIELVVKQWFAWKNKALTWDSKKPHKSVHNVTLPLRYLWSPDIIASSAVHIPEILSPELATVSSDGEILHEVQQRLVLHTDLKDLQSPFGVNVAFTFESWTYDNSKLRLTSPRSTGFLADNFESRHFKVSNTSVSRHFNRYPPSDNEYDVLTFSFNLKKF